MMSQAELIDKNHPPMNKALLVHVSQSRDDLNEEIDVEIAINLSTSKSSFVANARTRSLLMTHQTILTRQEVFQRSA